MQLSIRLFPVFVFYFLFGCNQFSSSDRENIINEQETTEIDTLREPLNSALTFHASFDNGLEADFGSGDRKIYNGNFNQYTEDSVPDIKAGLGGTPLTIVTIGGMYGAALEFPADNEHVAGFMLKDNLVFSEKNWSGTISFWLRLDTEDIPNKYCDPIQLTDKDYASDAIWVDITKNDIPPDFRMGFFGNQPTWDPKNLKGRSEEFFFRLKKISEPPFSRNSWTHVVVTWENINSENIGRAKLYINGEYMGPSGPVREPFHWNMEKATLRLGTGKFVGLFDDISIFKKALSLEEIKYLYNLPEGVAELHMLSPK